MRFYARKDDSIWLEGDTRAGLYDDPVLFVPAAVRVGMVWTHGARWRFEVIGHNPAADPPVWVIQVQDKERTTTNQENTEVLFGIPYTVIYYEGTPVGPFAGLEPTGITIADGIAVKQPGELTSQILSERLDSVATVTDAEIAGAPARVPGILIMRLGRSTRRQ